MATTRGQPLLVDPRGHRFGAGISAALLALAWLTNSKWLVAVACVTLATSAVFGLRYSIYGSAWRRLARAAEWSAADLEPEYAPRFAQTIGSSVLGAGLVLFGLGQATLGWVTVGAVVALQALLAATGFCLGCRLYFLNWWLPSVLTGWWRQSALEDTASAEATTSRS